MPAAVWHIMQKCNFFKGRNAVTTLWTERLICNRDEILKYLSKVLQMITKKDSREKTLKLVVYIENKSNL